MKISKKFAKNIREIAKDKKLQLGKIEKAVGVAPGYLSRFDKSNAEMTVDTVLRFCKEVEMSFDEVMNYFPAYDVMSMNDTIYITRGDRVVGTIAKEDIIAACKKVNELDIQKEIDRVLGVER